MRDFSVQSDQETSRNTAHGRANVLEASKPYIAVCLIVTILLSVWVGLCAA
jgi:hypothetical protein